MSLFLRILSLGLFFFQKSWLKICLIKIEFLPLDIIEYFVLISAVHISNFQKSSQPGTAAVSPYVTQDLRLHNATSSRSMKRAAVLALRAFLLNYSRIVDFVLFCCVKISQMYNIKMYKTNKCSNPLPLCISAEKKYFPLSFFNIMLSRIMAIQEHL